MKPARTKPPLDDHRLHPYLDSAELAPVVALARRAAALPATPVLIRAPEGAGGDELAALIHAGEEPPASRPFVVLHCRGVAEAALERELATGAPSAALARARTGTLYVDEVANLGARAQAAVVGLLEGARRPGGAAPARPHRLVFGTSVDLKRAVKERAFRADLLERLSVLTLDLPRLRDRGEDILPLARRLLAARTLAVGGKPLTAGACAKLLSYDWPGNCAELATVIERAVILEEGEAISDAAIIFAREAVSGGADSISDLFSRLVSTQSRPPTIDELEHAYLVWLLRFTFGNRTAASRLLGVSYPTIMKKIRDYEIDFKAFTRARRGA